MDSKEAKHHYIEVNDGIVVLATGNLDKKLTVKATRFTKAAAEKIEAAGGKIEVV